MKILSVGNSFSEDAVRYLHDAAGAAGERITTVNLYIPACSLEMHARQLRTGERSYGFQWNGDVTGISVSLEEAIRSDSSWDAVTFQQVSNLSPDFNTYEPWLSELSGFVRNLLPDTPQYIHETWAYGEDSPRLRQELGFRHSEDMLRSIRSACREAAETIHAQGIIPSGETVERLRRSLGSRVYRDGHHLSLGVGRYGAALTWYGFFTGKDPRQVPFREFDVPVPEDWKRLAAEAAAEALKTDF